MFVRIKKKRAFSLVEILLSAALITMFTTALIGALIVGREGAAGAGSRARAVLFAEEGLEAVATIRNRNFNELTNGVHGLIIAPPTDSWWNPGWKFRRKILFNNAIHGQHNDFPILVRVPPSFDYSSTLSGGSDIRFIDDDGITVLSHEVEEWRTDGVASSTVWVKVPIITAKSKTDHVWMYYNNPNPLATPPAGDASQVWSNNYTGVWHLKEDPAVSALKDSDTSTEANDGAQTAMTSADKITGFFDGGSNFASTKRINAGSGIEIDDTFATGGTLSAFIKPRTIDLAALDGDRIVDKGQYFLAVDGLNKLKFSHNFSAVNGAWLTPDNSIDLTKWNHIAVAYNRDAVAAPSLYINGTLQLLTTTAPSVTPSSDSASSLIIGNNTAGTRPFDGHIDEVRSSSVERSLDWIIAQCRVLAGNFVLFGPEEFFNDAIYRNSWRFSGTQETAGEFMRKITISSIDVRTKEALSEVTWKISPLRVGKVDLIGRFTNWTGVFDAGTTVTGTGNAAVDLAVNTSSAEITSGDDRLEGMILSNGGASPLTIDKMVISWTPNGGETIHRIRFDNSDPTTVWHEDGPPTPAPGPKPSGTTLDIVNFTINPGESVPLNRVDFNAETMLNKQFTITFIMDDGSSVTVEVFGTTSLCQ